MAQTRDTWAERLAALAWPAVALAANYVWSRAVVQAVRLRAGRGGPARAGLGPALHHVQLAMPADQEAAARRFYGELLGWPELARPANLAARGGCWFALGQGQLHLGVEEDFRPARKAHPALLVDDVAGLRRRLEAAGVTARDDQPLAGYRRFHADDPFGNRLEFLEAQPGS